MTARLQHNALDASLSSVAFDDDQLSTSSAVVAVHEEALAPPVVVARKDVQRVMRALAAERIDDVTHTFFACALLVMAAGGIAVSSVAGPPALSMLALSMVAGAVVIIGVVRFRLRRELVRVGQAQGLNLDEARREADALLVRLLRLD